MNTESLKMKNTKQKARHIVTGFSLWRRTRDSLSLRFPNQPSRAVVRSASSTAAPRRRLLNSIGVSGWYACTRIATPPLPKQQAFRGPPILSLYRPQDALGQNAHAASNAALGSNLHAFQKQQPIRKRVWAVAGGGQEIRTLAPR